MDSELETGHHYGAKLSIRNILIGRGNKRTIIGIKQTNWGSQTRMKPVSIFPWCYHARLFRIIIILWLEFSQIRFFKNLIWHLDGELRDES